MSSSDFKVGDKVWVKSDSGVEELATIIKLPTNNTNKLNDTKEYNNKEHNNDGNNNSTTITESIDSDKPKEIAVKSEATVSSNLTEYSE